ncbi:MAG TPA: hypothetical protein VNA25_27910 [Phycisphaerae bacterium]|nr:hypothetical protein [Phycisphaerae bacterium]
MLRSRTALVLATLVLVTAAVGADDVTIKKWPVFKGATITEVKAGQITFRPSSGVVNTKPMSDVQSVRVDGSDDLNRAEALVAQGKAAEAVSAYDAALRRARAGTWQARLARYRRLAALEAAGLIDRAAEEWLVVMDESGSSAAAVAMRPKVADKPSGADRAISRLEVRLKTISSKPYQSAIKGLLLSLYQKQGMKDKAEALAAELSGKTVTPSATGARDQLRGLEVRIEQGEAAQALAGIRKNIESYGSADLPKALLLAGRAQMALAGKASGDEKRALLIEAGLDLMRVYAYFPRSQEAAESLYLAGQVNASLPKPNLAAAAAAYKRVIETYGSSPFAAKAKQALEKISK